MSLVGVLALDLLLEDLSVRLLSLSAFHDFFLFLEAAHALPLAHTDGAASCEEYEHKKNDSNLAVIILHVAVVLFIFFVGLLFLLLESLQGLVDLGQGSSLVYWLDGPGVRFRKIFVIRLEVLGESGKAVIKGNSFFTQLGESIQVSLPLLVDCLELIWLDVLQDGPSLRNNFVIWELLVLLFDLSDFWNPFFHHHGDKVVVLEIFALYQVLERLSLHDECAKVLSCFFK